MSETPPRRPLRLKIKGRIIDHLGIQMYQSPVAALAELVSNSWDADAEFVDITIPSSISASAEIVVQDTGIGMTYDQCNDFYLEVGRARRGSDPNEHTPLGRPVLGRKGIGKFAGFGIAEVIRVETISKETGEFTAFELDINRIRAAASYVEEGDDTVTSIEHQPADPERTANHGTTIKLKRLILGRAIPIEQFRLSMSRRFLIAARSDNFSVKVNGIEIPDNGAVAGVEFSFPRDYADNEVPENLTIDGEWGTESLSDGRDISWRIDFYEETIDDEELRGVAIFAKGKLAQVPFFFQLSGGLGGQHGQQYLSGHIRADFIDSLPSDLIAPERQRVNWQLKECAPLLEWGQHRVRQLLRLWKEKRAEENIRVLEAKVSQFKDRLDRLQRSERETVKRALRQLAGIPTLRRSDFESLGGAILTAWEGGRLRDLIARLGEPDDLTEKELLAALLELNVITALHTAEAVIAKLEVVHELRERVQRGELEKAVRDYVARNPWLIDPRWETFVVERSVDKLVRDAGSESGLASDPEFKGRVDLVLASGETLLILEFMRPGLTLDYDHVDRFERYVRILREKTGAETGVQFTKVNGYLVADNLGRKPGLADKIKSLQREEMWTLSWDSLLAIAEAKWKEFMFVLKARAPEDMRLANLGDGSE